jgi:hypothetical protein
MSQRIIVKDLRRDQIRKIQAQMLLLNPKPFVSAFPQKE